MPDTKSLINAAVAALGPDPEWERVKAAVEPLLGPFVRLSRKRVRGKGPFLRQRIPWSWLFAAGQLPGKSLHLGLLLWNQVGCRGGRQVKLNLRKAEAFGMHRDTARRALKALRRAGLVRVSPRPGSLPLITLLDVPSPAEQGKVPEPEKSQSSSTR